MTTKSNAVVGILYINRRSRRLVAGYIASVHWGDGEGLNVKRGRVTFDLSRAHGFPLSVALDVAKQYRRGGCKVFITEGGTK